MVEESANILVGFSNKRINSALSGASDYQKLYNDTVRLQFLVGALNAVYLDGTTAYIGSAEVSDSYIQEIYHKIWHYSGKDADLSVYEEIVADNGDGGSIDNGSVVVVDNNMRIGELAVGTGANVVTFYLGGVATPFPSTDYQVDAWLITNSGYMQRQVVVSNKLANGFTVEDILEAGVLHYQATLNT